MGEFAPYSGVLMTEAKFRNYVIKSDQYDELFKNCYHAQPVDTGHFWVFDVLLVSLGVGAGLYFTRH